MYTTSGVRYCSPIGTTGADRTGANDMSINRKAWTAVVAADIAIDAAANYSTAMLSAAEGIASTLGALLDRSAGRPGKNDPQAEAIKAWGEMKAAYVACTGE